MIPLEGHGRDVAPNAAPHEASNMAPLEAAPRQVEGPMARPPLVVLVDDDESVRESLPDLLRALGYDAEAFASPLDFLRSRAADRADCLLLDLAMPGMSGTELQAELVRLEYSIPVVFITAQLEPGLRDRLLTTGAADCLFKPFDDDALRDTLTAALSTD